METFSILQTLNTGIICPPFSLWVQVFFFVEKKDKSLQPCINYQGLIQITIKNKYPLPLRSSAFNPLHEATVFSQLDLCNAYHLVRIREGDEWKTTFNTPLGYFEYLVMPFGLTNVLEVFHALVNDVVWEFSFFCFLDNI